MTTGPNAGHDPAERPLPRGGVDAILRRRTLTPEAAVHELGMCQAVLDKVEHHAQGRSVAAVGVQVGDGLAVEPDVFAQGFAVLARGGIADGAEVAITSVEGDGLVLEWLRYREPTIVGGG